MEDLIVATNPKSSFAEAIKLIKTNITFSSVDKDFKTILMTSPESGDGKSFLVANLASAFAQEGKRVLIIDADLRRGRQHKIFHLENENAFGYSNLILAVGKNQDFSGSLDKQVKNNIKETKIKGVSLLPAGPTPPNPLELLSSESNKQLLDALKSYYDVIFLDCPPSLGLSDALVMSKYSDINIVTISNAKTKIDQLESVKKNFERVNSKISGVIINKAKVKQSSYSSYYTNDKYYTDNLKK
ncbi:MAG: CpsD/CapB family tyrosine-protein kinase [Candidatus Saccharibacteria bacterium]|nr:CpsD/CapB family tyrosine-protein kinase [Candidatus Saccharibacteria bacterium]